MSAGTVPKPWLILQAVAQGDSDWTRDTESCRPTSGYVLVLNSAAVAVAIGIYDGDVIGVFSMSSD